MDFSTFYNEERYSDIVLVLRTKVVETVAVTGLTSRNHTGNDVTTDDSPISHDDITLPAHAMALDNASPYFKARLSTAWQSTLTEPDITGNDDYDDRLAHQEDIIATEKTAYLSCSSSNYCHYCKRVQQATQEASPERVSAPTPSTNNNKRVVLIEYVEEGEVSSIKAVIKSMYTGKLDMEVRTSPLLLLQCYMAASRFNVQHCIQDCATALNNLPTHLFTVEVLVKIYDSPHFLSDFCSPQFAILRQKASEVLLRTFGDVPAILCGHQSTSPGRAPARALLEQFLSLPYHAVLQWLQADKLVVHSENCVVALLSLWMVLGDNGKRCSIAESTELMKNLRVLQLTASYLLNFPSIAWVKVVFDQSPALRSAFLKTQYCRVMCQPGDCFLQADYDFGGYSSWFEGSGTVVTEIPKAWTLRRRASGARIANISHGLTAIYDFKMQDADALCKQYGGKGFTPFLCTLSSPPELMYCSGYWLSVGVGVSYMEAEPTKDRAGEFQLCCYLYPTIDSLIKGAEETVISFTAETHLRCTKGLLATAAIYDKKINMEIASSSSSSRESLEQPRPERLYPLSSILTRTDLSVKEIFEACVVKGNKVLTVKFIVRDLL
ncbi:hypothetical protein CEUSTIGMA_g11355.t1 [Chlamydomonas eustigma]|uniref:Uncharacterized protein n=1 Tax=Chlamydomonas eustigma TaxID=1157962 RepID=A0A250XLF6_9CHLO|nr:hypothetical protein CEUSTIGMA_g11355.t1 [Chlamydomonas eustigma]|eukprot:GAX83931.1 hypothetical protein CEUSTIGMA_g11355.t1 [Chlamydomonas eustigma]